jgi:hypothetical protein
MKRQNFIASVRNEHLDHIEQVAQKLREKGCEITGILKITGVISGSVNETTDLNELKMEGIASIEKQRTVRKK